MNIFKIFGIYAVGQALNSCIRFFLIPYYSYLLSVSDFGRVGMVWVFVPIMTMLIGMGTTASVSLKYYKVADEMKTRLTNFALVSTLVVFFVFLIMIFFLYPRLEKIFLLDVPVIVYLKLTCAAYAAFLIEFILAWFKVRIEPQKFVLFNTVYTVVSIGFLLFYLSILDQGFLGFVEGTVYGNMVTAFFLLAVYIRSSDSFFFNIPAALAKDLLRLSLPIAISFLVSYVMMYSGRYVLAQVATMTDVGIYTMGTRLGDAFNLFFVAPFLAAISPVLFKLAAEDQNGFVSEMKRYLNLYLIGGGLLLLFANVVLTLAFHFVINEAYSDSVVIAEIAFWNMLIFGTAQLVGSVNLVNERIRLMTIFTIFCGVLNLGLTYVLVPVIGVGGGDFGVPV